MKTTEKESGDWTEPASAQFDALRRLFGSDEEENSWQRIRQDPRLGAVRHRHSDPYLGFNPPEVAPSVSNSRLAAEVTALRREVAELKDEQRRIKEDQARWARAIEQKLDELQGFDAHEVPIDPHTAWINANRPVLQKYPDTWVILDPERGIVFDSRDEDEIAARLAALSPEERERVMALHTSLYT